LALEERRFRETIKLINYRSNLHYSQVQPRLIAAGVQEGTPYPNTLFEKALGPLLFTTLKQVTEQVYYTVDRSVTSMDDLKSRLLSGWKELFPEGDFLKFELMGKEANNRPHKDRS
jgi:hypothetical protein